MPIGGYIVVIGSGSEVIEHELIADAGHPNVGERIVLDGATYVVVAVQHEEERDSHASARHTYARVFLRPLDSRRAPRPRPDGDAPSAILPFVAPPGVDGCAILPPALVAVLVVAGYSEQKMVYRTGRRRVAQLLRAGDRWMALNGADAWRLSRLAKRQLHGAIRFALTLAGGHGPAVDDDGATTLPCAAPARAAAPPRSPTAGPETAPPARSARPALRLVPGGQDREDGGEDATRET